MVTQPGTPIDQVVDWRGRIGPTDEATLGEAAELLGISPGAVSDLVDAGELPACTVYSAVRISLADIEIYRLRSELGTSALGAGDAP